MNIEHEWTKAAIIDDSMVAELLLRLNHVTPPSSSLPPRLHWSVRQRRSKSASVKPAPRDSPTNPLSWSGATSFSGEVGGAADGSCEESSRLNTPLSKPHTSTRSKVNTTSSKRSRKKRTLTELKDEEILLIKERKQLQKELTHLRANLEKQRNTNQNLKRMKLDVEQQQANERGKTVVVVNDGIAGQSQQKGEPSNAALPIVLESVQRNVALSSSLPENCYFREQKVQVAYQESKFVLPDLNLPSEEDPRAEILCLS